MIFRLGQLLAQTTPAAPVPPPAAPPVIAPPAAWLSLDTIFWFTMFLIFLITVLSALLRRLAKDKTLKLFHEYHVALFSEKRPTLWGDCLIYSQGMELLFDQPFTTRRKLVKSSAMIYEDEFVPMICLTRTIQGLNEQELRDRAAQIHRTFKPSMLRKSDRWLRNLLNTMRDAITKTMSLVIGRMSMATGNIAGAAMSTQAGDISALTGSVVNLAANAYEPLLERYIGQPVVVEINLPTPPGPPPPGWVPETAEFPGYLVDYSQKFIAVFNVDQTPVETVDVKIDAGKPPATDVAELKITATAQDTIIRCEGKDAFVLRRIASHGEAWDLGIAMIPGTTVVLGPITGEAVLTVERTRQIDLIVPRTRARVRFGSKPVRPHGPARRDWLGLSPVMEGRDLLAAFREKVHGVGESLRAGMRRHENEPPEKNDQTK